MRDAEDEYDDDDLEGGLERTHLVFRVGEAAYAIPVQSIREIVRVDRIFPIPAAPRFVRGLIDLRGRGIVLLDLRSRLGLPSLPTSDRMVVIVLECGPRPSGLVVDAVVEVSEIDPATVDPTRQGTMGDAAIGVLAGSAKQRDRLVFLLDVDVLARDAQLGMPGECAA